MRKKCKQQPSANLALVGMHGPPEATGPALLERVMDSPVNGWDVEVANEAALEAGVRNAGRNLVTAFADADPASKEYQLRRADELLELAEGRQIVLDVHDQPTTRSGDYVLLGKKSNPRLLGAAMLLGIRRVVMLSHEGHLTHHKPNALVVEMARGNQGQLVAQNVRRLRMCMRVIAQQGLQPVRPKKFSYYEYVTEVRTQRARELGLDRMDRLEPFRKVPDEILQRLQPDLPHLPPGEYATDYWNGESSDPLWFGSLLRRIDCPFG